MAWTPKESGLIRSPSFNFGILMPKLKFGLRITPNACRFGRALLNNLLTGKPYGVEVFLPLPQV